jgi:hypothetical protein
MKEKEKGKEPVYYRKKEKNTHYILRREKLNIIHPVIATCATAYCHNMEYGDAIR